MITLNEHKIFSLGRAVPRVQQLEFESTKMVAKLSMACQYIESLAFTEN